MADARQKIIGGNHITKSSKMVKKLLVHSIQVSYLSTPYKFKEENCMNKKSKHIAKFFMAESK